jgi:hypothetical protein
MTSAATPEERRDVGALYQPAGHALWLDAAGCPTANAHDALALLRSAADDGLDPDDYQSARLDHLSAELDAGLSTTAETAAAFRQMFDLFGGCDQGRVCRSRYPGRRASSLAGEWRRAWSTTTASAPPMPLARG